MWSDGLGEWFAANGRHQLPWRLTTDPWAVLVSEVMLQQTSVARVLPRWQRFVERWPTAADCAHATLSEVLLEWQGLGYPRRARALWLTAAEVLRGGWPDGEAALRALPGVGVYTARALLAFTTLGSDKANPPRDVNLGRVAARAALGRDPAGVAPSRLDAVLRDGRPAGMSLRHYSYALFDVGATRCRARPDCARCPLGRGCLARAGDLQMPAATARRPPYRGSLRQLRGALLTETLSSPSASSAQLARAVSAVPGATPQRIRAALDSLAADGLVTGRPAAPG
ncbi:MAG TPA: A/G-specific adenine glycosylase [Candidatus Dormibacteraeota bacterium]|nr:A/G-specific adenine glycosylase [Candidatus Dormibacteraeota bacterium]